MPPILEIRRVHKSYTFTESLSMLARTLFVLSFFILVAIFVLFPETDISFSRLFYSQGQGFYLAQNPLIIAIHKGVPVMCGITAIICGLIGIKILMQQRSL